MDGTKLKFGEAVTGHDALTDSKFLQSVAWRKSADKALVRLARRGESTEFCNRWLSLYANPPKPKRKRKRSAKGDSMAYWSRSAFELSSRASQLFDILDLVENREIGALSVVGENGNGQIRSKHRQRVRRINEGLLEWIQSVLTESPISPIELVGLLDLLVTSSAKLDPAIWFQIWRQTLTATLQLNQSLEEPYGTVLPADHYLLIKGELPWRYGLFFSDLQNSGQFRRKGRNYLRTVLLDATDTDGCPNAASLERLPYWLASFVRSLDAANRRRVSLWKGQTADRFQFFVERAVSFLRSDDRLALSDTPSIRPSEILEVAAKLAGFKRSSPVRRLPQEISSNPTKRPKRRTMRRDDDYPGTQSDWSEVACLRTDWSRDADLMVVAHHKSFPVIDVSVMGQPLLEGQWEAEVSLNGEAVALDTDWECVCWHSDDDVDYVELQSTIEGRLKVGRQIVLSRDDRYLLLADSVAGAGEHQVEYTSRLPLAEGVQAVSQTESRECRLRRDKVTARLFPLALPQDRVQSTAGGCGPYSDHVLLKQVSSREGLFAPMLIDWHPRRRRKAAEWRTLTVTESRTILKPWQAAGHRLRLADLHLLVYRTLQESESSRAVLGHHTLQETVVGNFDDSGEVEALLLVDQ